MAPLTMKTCLGSFLVLATASVTVLAVQRLRKRSNANLPPMAPLNPWDVARELTSSTLPLFQFKTGLDLGCPVFRLPLPFGQCMYTVMDPATATTVFKDDEHKSPVFTKAVDKAFGGPSLVTLPTASARWQKTRRALAHVFAPPALAHKVPLLHEQVEHLIAKLDEHCISKEEVDILPLVLRFALDFVGLAVFDYNLRTFEDPVHSDGALYLEEIMLALDEFLLHQLVNPFRRFMFWNADVRRAHLSVKRLIALALKILNHYRETHSEEEIQHSPSLIAEILRNPHYPDDAARASEVTAFLMGGFDSTGCSIAWCLYDLARHPEIASEVTAELDDAMAADIHLCVNQLSHLKLLDACIKESLRLWPVFGMGHFRITTKDTHYKDMVIPAGSEVNVTSYGTGRWPENIEGAEEYRPHRWFGTQEEIDALEERFVMFAKGRRNCVAQNLAKLELRLVLARLLHRFEFKVAQEPIYYHTGTSKPLNLKLHVRRRA